VALGFSIAGVLHDDRKHYAALMLLVSGALTLWIGFLLLARIAHLVR
jgi:hypothetical protein